MNNLRSHLKAVGKPPIAGNLGAAGTSGVGGTAAGQAPVQVAAQTSAGPGGV